MDIQNQLRNAESISFNESVNKAISYAKRYQKLFALFIIQVQRAMPLALEETTAQLIEKNLTNSLRNEDILTKLNANEFIILLNDIGKAKFASSIANKLLQAIALIDTSLTAHIGICVYPTEGDSLESLLKNADIALSKAKAAGGNHYRFYTQKLDAEATEYSHLEKSLRKACANNEFILHYQPKLDLKTGSISRVEALIRWAHPEKGLIYPDKFLPITEENGLIHQISTWILQEACKINKHWQDEGYEHIPIAVNLSAKQFYDPNLVQIVQQALEDSQLSPSYLELEVTEPALTGENQEQTNAIFANLKNLGVQISLDHFGRGYFSIMQLKQYPLNTLKIDQSFIKGIPNNPDDSAITTAIIGLAHHLGLEVVAEGVETAEQVQYLAGESCDMVQGYFLSRPLPANQILLQFKKLSEKIL